MSEAGPLLWAAAGALPPLLALAGVLLRRARLRPAERRRAAALEALLREDGRPRMVLDAEGRPIAGNAAGTRRWGADGPLAEARALLPDGDEAAAAALARLESAVANGGADSQDIVLAYEDGRIEWLRVTVAPAATGGTSPRGRAVAEAVLWQAEDVTARRAIDDVLRQDRDDLSDFLHFLPVGIYSADSDGILRRVNQRFAEWLGHDPGALEGLPLRHVLHDGPAPEGDGTWRGVVVFRTRDGDPLPAFVAQDVYDDGGVTRTRTAVLRLDDVPPRHGEAAATPSERGAGRGDAAAMRLFDRAPTALAVLDAAGGVEAANPRFAQLMNRTGRDLVERRLGDLVGQADRESVEALLARMALAPGGGGAAELDVRLGDGEAERVCSLAVAALTGEGEGVTGFLVHAVDATERKNLEMQFAQAQKMQAMGQLAGGVAHDFNNLLTAMIGFCDLLLQRHGPGDPSFADIMQIKQNANRAANLVRQLLAFSRRQPLLPKLMNVTDALSELSHLLRRLLGEHVTLAIVNGRDLGLVRVDPGQFDQVIINLAVNARDAMPGGGNLTVRTATVDVTTTHKRGVEEVPPGRYVEIEVADTGTGISQDYIGRIFEPFFSTKAGVTGAGTGLGLSTVYGIVRQTEGFIFVTSEPGAGARFSIWLPRHDPETGQCEVAAARKALAVEDAVSVRPGGGGPRPVDAGTPTPPAPAPADAAEEETAAADDGPVAGGGRILLVEDEDAVRVFAMRALRNKGYTVMEARTGEGAVDILRDAPDIDLLITDMVMPGMDGATLARLVRVERPDMKVILISGYSEEAARADLMDSPGVHFMPKPFNLAQLARKVRQVMEA